MDQVGGLLPYDLLFPQWHALSVREVLFGILVIESVFMKKRALKILGDCGRSFHFGHDWWRSSITTISGIGCPSDGLLQPQLGQNCNESSTDPVFAGSADLFLLELLPPARCGTSALHLQTRCLLPGTSLTWGNGYSTLASYFRFRLGLGQMGGVSRSEGVYKKPKNKYSWLEIRI